jgi:hypothetical protein
MDTRYGLNLKEYMNIDEFNEMEVDNDNEEKDENKLEEQFWLIFLDPTSANHSLDRK